MKLKTEFSSIILVNLLDKDGNPSWPERYSKEDCNRIESDTDPFTYQREYCNNPVEEGRIFKAEWIRYRKAKHFNQYPCLIGHWDLSYKKEGDFKAMALLGFDEQGLIVLDIFCRKCDITDAIQYHFDLVRRLKSEGTGAIFFYDATAAQQEVFGPLFEQEAARQRLYEYPLPDRTAVVDKYLRIEATLTNVLFNKTLAFAEHLAGTPDLKMALNQLLAFEKGSTAHDDFPDTLEAAVRLMQKYAYDASLADSEFKPRIGIIKRKGF
jgi:hypothetical protein